MTAPIDLYLAERRQAILAKLDAAQRVSVAELSREFGVSEVTIRTDLQALAEQGLAVRTHGGAVAAGTGAHDIALAARRQRKVQEKVRIGGLAADLVQDGMALFLDSSSTSLSIATQLKSRRHVTVLTNSLAVANELLDAQQVHVVMTGGILQPETASLVGTAGLAWIEQYNIQLGFFGAHGISDPEGLTDVNPEQAELKRPLVQLCRQVVAVLDASKWGQIGIASFAQLTDIDIILTDADAPAAPVSAMRQRGIQVRTAPEKN
jgi:DeoR/GlpR family transcriptional regulator of sugar metabolism